MNTAVTITDDRGITYRLREPPKRIVSLVPSDTYTLLRLGAGDRLVARTTYCVEPRGLVDAIPTVGGTKVADVEAILDARPDLVVMNQEENTRRTATLLENRGARLFVTFPRRVGDGLALVARFAQMLGDAPAVKPVVREAYRAFKAATTASRAVRLRAFVPIWMDPLMTANGDTFIADVLTVLGLDNVFADRERRFPLAADLGRAPVLVDARSPDSDGMPSENSKGRDTRYPRITADEIVLHQPDIVLLPDEPHPFGEEERRFFLGLDIPAARTGRIHLTAGRDLMWPGLRSLEGLARLDAIVRGAS